MPEPSSAARPSLFSGKALFWLPILPLVILDLWSKSAVFAFLAKESGQGAAQLPLLGYLHPVWGGPVSFDLVNWLNEGTVWGLFEDYHFPLVVLRCLAVAVILHFVFRAPQKARIFQLALALVMAGALGNLYDNLMPYFGHDLYNGGVRDFLLFTFELPFLDKPWRFPAFNVADSCITVGAATLMAHLIFWPPVSEKPNKSEKAGKPEISQAP